jgi:hypothetical protein
VVKSRASYTALNTKRIEQRKEIVDAIAVAESRLDRLTPRQLRSLEKARKMVRYKRDFVDETIEGLIDHEFGHWLHWTGYINIGMDRKRWGELWTEAVKEAGEAGYRYNISSYAFADVFVLREEVFAESFALYQQGQFVDIPPKMLSLIRRVMP